MYWGAHNRAAELGLRPEHGPSRTRVQRIQRPVTRHCLPICSPQHLYKVPSLHASPPTTSPAVISSHLSPARPHPKRCKLLHIFHFMLHIQQIHYDPPPATGKHAASCGEACNTSSDALLSRALHASPQPRLLGCPPSLHPKAAPYHMPRPAGAGPMDSATLFSLEANPANPSVAPKARELNCGTPHRKSPMPSEGRLSVDARTAEHPLGSCRRLTSRREGARPLQSALVMGPQRTQRRPSVLG